MARRARSKESSESELSVVDHRHRRFASGPRFVELSANNKEEEALISTMKPRFMSSMANDKKIIAPKKTVVEEWHEDDDDGGSERGVNNNRAQSRDRCGTSNTSPRGYERA